MDSFNSCDLVRLDLLIDDFLHSFKLCFQRRITPKMHHLVHYSDYIKKMGPLLSVWCIRYEAKHAYFKQLMRSIRNFINIPLTLSMWHQQWQCNRFRLAKNNCSGEKVLCVIRTQTSTNCQRKVKRIKRQTQPCELNAC